MQKIHADSSFQKDQGFNFLSRSVFPISLSYPLGLSASAWINGDDKMWREGMRSTVSTVLANSFSYGLKNLIRRDRPFHSYPNWFRNKGRAGELSFPSGHTTAAFATATSIALTYKKWELSVPAFLWAGGVAYSRMYLGVHYPSDILGGMIIGVGTTLLTWKVDQYILKNKSR